MPAFTLPPPDPEAPAGSGGGDRRVRGGVGSRPVSSEGVSEINRRYYGDLAAGRDDYWRRMAAPRHRVETILALLEELRPGRIVDLGCGNGRLLREVALRFPSASLTGVDFSAPQIERNRMEQPAIEWICQDLEEPRGVGEGMAHRFDAIVASELIEHLDDPRRLLRRAWQMAAPAAGRLILTTQSGPVRETERRVGHRAHFSAGAMRELLTATGWRAIRVWNTGFPFHDLSKWLANLSPDVAMQRFGDRSYGWLERGLCLALRAAFRLNSHRRGAQLFALARRAGED